MPIKINPLPPLEVLEEWFSYNPETGELRWRKHAQGHKGWEGKPAGSVKQNGYLEVTLQGRRLKGHRIAFKMATEFDPPVEVDHRDGNRSNNRLSNLRLPEGRPDNAANAKVQTNNTSGHVGVHWSKGAKLWIACIKRHGNTHTASFLHKEEAIAWRHQKELELHGEFAQHRRNGAPQHLQRVEERTTRRDNTSGVKGVSRCHRDRLWTSYINEGGTRIQAYFHTKEEAIAQRKAWEAERDNKPEQENE